MTLSRQEAKIFLRVAHHYVSETSEDKDIARVFNAIHQTADYADGDIKRWVKAVEQVLDREDEGFEPVFRPAAVASAEAALVN